MDMLYSGIPGGVVISHKVQVDIVCQQLQTKQPHYTDTQGE